MLAVFAAPQLYGNAAAQAQQAADTSALDMAAMRVGKGKFLHNVTVIVNKAKTLTLEEPFEDLAVGSSDIADVVPISDRQLYILGKNLGTTNVLIYGHNKKVIGIMDIEVKLDAGRIGAKIRQASGGSNIHAEDVGGKLVIKGDSGDAPTAERAMEVAAAFGPGAVNALKATAPQQVMLKVRFVEASRQAIRELGLRWSFFNRGREAGVIGSTGTTTAFRFPNPANAGFPLGLFGPSGEVFDATSSILSSVSPTATVLAQLLNRSQQAIDVVLSALERRNYLRTLAEPNLVALSGETADFLAGGEYPFPVVAATGGLGLPTVTIQYKPFGVSLRFTPTVLSRGVISLVLKPEVSDIDPAIQVGIPGSPIPAFGFRVQRATTRVELRDGQSFAIAGLLRSSSGRALDQLPWVGEIPIIGALFRSTEFRQQETELVILVTPYVVKPVPPNEKLDPLKTPLDTTLPANDVDLFLFGHPEVDKTPPAFTNQVGQPQSLTGAIAPGAPGIPPGAPPVVLSPIPLGPVATGPGAAVPVPLVAVPVGPVAEPPPPSNVGWHFDPLRGYVMDPPENGGTK